MIKLNYYSLYFLNHLDLENNKRTSLLKDGNKKRLVCKHIFRIKKTIKKQFDNIQ